MRFDQIAIRFNLRHQLLLSLLLLLGSMVSSSVSAVQDNLDGTPPSPEVATSKPGNSEEQTQSVEVSEVTAGASGEDREADPDQTYGRLVIAGLAGGTLLGWLVVLFAYLRLEHATRGFYSGKLQSVAVVCALAILGLSYFAYISLSPLFP